MAKYSDGSRVRIKAGVWPGDAECDLWRYNNLTGKITSSGSAIAHQMHSWAQRLARPFDSIRVHKVRLDLGIELENVTEEHLEAV